ncbi:MAG: hypothetical protein KGL39_14215 [Patescibacteria group bacterium]|nr:hypothetical protein [Patescibacteria group bacterium]
MVDTSIPREEFEFRKEVLERMTRMETILAPLANGRIGSIEADVAKLKEGRAGDRRVVAVIGVTVSALFALCKAYLRIP